ncbi:MAG: T9SS type A sorting domain-containing protein [Bacteroidetes bacterium]|nr:T9SS type A sorting domain-containing protein [Bacteroidota bacterium]
MKKLFLISTVSLLLTVVHKQTTAQGTWTPKAVYGAGLRQGAVGFSIGTKGYIGMGNDDLGNFMNDLWQYDTVAGSWTQKASLSVTGSYGAVGFSIGTKGYVGTGYDGTGYTNNFWEWNQATNIWTQKSNFGGAPREYAVGFSIGTKGYIGTGEDLSNTYNDFWEWDQASDIWIQKSNFGGVAAYGAVGFSIGTKGYIGTGNNGNQFWEWNQTTDTWIQRANFGGTSRKNAVGFAIGNSGLICTGEANSNGASLFDCWRYNPGYDNWTQIASVAKRDHAVGFSIGTKGFIGTGHDNSSGFSLQDFWELNPPAPPPPCDWIKKTNFGGNARDGAVGFSIGLKGYIGTASGSNPDDFWEYDQVTDTWTQKADFPGIGRGYAVGFSIGKKGYIGTGYKFPNNLNDFWEWDQASNMWTQKANFGGTGRYFAVGFSIGKKGYIGTGLDDDSLRSDFWEWDGDMASPSYNTWTQKANFLGVVRQNPVGFSIGTKGYIGTGLNGTTFFNDFWEWEQATNVWVQKANFGGTKRRFAVGFSIGTKGYIGTGVDSIGEKQDVWQWNQATDTWKQISNFCGLARWQAVGFSIGNKGYIGTGNYAGYLKDFWEWTDTCQAGISASGTTIICPGDSVILTATAGSNYLWSNGATTQSITVNTYGSFNVAVNLTNGCVSPSTSAYVTTSGIPPASNFNYYGLYYSGYCTGNPIQFYPYLLTWPTCPALNTLWNFGDPASGPANTDTSWTPLHTFSSAGTYTVMLIMNGGDTIINTVTINSGQTITDFTYSDSCVGSQVWFNPVFSACAGESWLWNFGDTASGPANIDTTLYPSHFYNTPGNYTVTFIVNGTDTIIKTLIISGQTITNFTYSDSCTWSSVCFYPDPITCPGQNWVWNFGDTASGFANIDSSLYACHIFNSAGYYTVTLIVDGVDTIIKTLTIGPFVNLGNDTVITPGDTIILDAGNPGPWNTYYWSTGDNTQTIFVTDTGTYIVEVYDSVGCWGSDTIHITFSNPNGQTNYADGLLFTISPNPTSGVISLQCSEKLSNIEISNLIGEKMILRVIPIGAMNLTIDLSNKPQGIYFIKVNSEKGTATKKIMIQ